MLSLSSLEIPILGAPMAGGPSTPELTAAVSRAGGLGLLGGAYLSAQAFDEQIVAVRENGCERFGVNLFVLTPPDVNNATLEAYRTRLQSVADPRGVALPPIPAFDDDGYQAKLDVAVKRRVPVVTFTFGLPAVDDVVALHGADIAIGITVTSVVDALAAVDRGADFLVVQGPEAGGHRSTFDCGGEPPTQPLIDLLADVAAAVELPLVAAGGVADGGDVARLLNGGADAVAVGTLLLRTPEAGTKPLHKAALADPQFTETAVTRAFSGRPARGLTNWFMRAFESATPSAYPQVNKLTGPIRAAAAQAGDPQLLSLWAGTGYRSATERPAAEVVSELWSQAKPSVRG